MSENSKTTEVKEFNTMLSRVNQSYFPMIQRQLEGNSIEFSQYAKNCVVNALGAINNALEQAGTSFGDPNLDQSNITQALITIATLQVNAAANPRECYFIVRNQKVKGADGKEVWKKKIELGLEGDAFDSILSRFGRNVKKVYPYWVVREDDDFKYPRYAGLEITPPEWQPKGTGKVVRVVYPIQSTDGTVDYYIAERADVKRNLIAHISNNLMNETFGVCADRYKATEEQKRQIAEKKKELLDKAKELELDALLDSAEFDKFISPAWKEEQSRESMIIRKMRNNITKKIPKNFSSSFEAEIYNENTDESYKAYNAEYEVVEDEPLEPIMLADGTKVDASTGEVKNQPEF